MICKYCSKEKENFILCCLWSYYSGKNNGDITGYSNWYKQNKMEVQKIINQVNKIQTNAY